MVPEPVEGLNERYTQYFGDSLFCCLLEVNMKFCVCGHCGRSIFKEFVFCPWCGVKAVKTQAEYAESRANMFLIHNDEERKVQLEAMGKRIIELEQELNVLVLSHEMHL